MITGILAAAAVATGAGVVVLGWARRRLIVVTVRGPSMEPTLRHGDRVLARRSPPAAPERGQLVVIERPLAPDLRPTARGRRFPRQWLVKRVAAVAGQPVPRLLRAAPGVSGHTVPADHLLVLGDNPESSYDSRHFGCLPADTVLGVVTSGRVPRHRG